MNKDMNKGIPSDDTGMVDEEALREDMELSKQDDEMSSDEY